MQTDKACDHSDMETFTLQSENSQSWIKEASRTLDAYLIYICKFIFFMVVKKNTHNNYFGSSQAYFSFFLI